MGRGDAGGGLAADAADIRSEYNTLSPDESIVEVQWGERMTSNETKHQSKTICTSCWAVHTVAMTCQDDFYQMLYWEQELMAEGMNLMDVHFLMVACYHMQHPHLYSSETLIEIRRNVAEFLKGRRNIDDIRRKTGEAARSDRRKHKITGYDGNHGGYATPVQWTMRAMDVVAAGKDQYVVSVRRWAKSVIAALEDVEVVAR